MDAKRNDQDDDKAEAFLPVDGTVAQSDSCRSILECESAVGGAK
jgi:hypothetical protein